mgnify:CR=1 FL=1
MAQQIKITMKEDNGTDFDTLYPQTVSNQVIMQDENGALTNKTLDDKVDEIAIDGGAFQVGDTLTTARTNLGDKWLLCNGAELDSTNYPDLYNMLSPNIKMSLAHLGRTGNYYAGSISFSYGAASDRPVGPEGLFLDDGVFQYATSTSHYISSSSRTYYKSVIDSYIDLTENYSSTMNPMIYSSGLTILFKKIGQYIFYFCNDLNVDNGLKYSNGTISSTSDLIALPNVSRNISGVADVVYFNNKYYFSHGETTAYSSPHVAAGLFVLDDLSQSDYVYIPETVYPDFVAGNTRTGGQISICNNELFVSTGVSGTNQNIILYKLVNDTLQSVQLPAEVSNVRYSCSVQYANNKYYLYLNDNVYSCPDINNPQWELIHTMNTNDFLLYKRWMYKTNNNTIILPDGYYIYNDTVSSYSVLESGIVTSVSEHENQLVVLNLYKPTSTSWGVKILTLDAITLPTISLADNLYTYIKAKS